LFFKYPSIPPGAITSDRLEHMHALAEGLPRAEIVEIQRRQVKLRLPGVEQLVEGDVSQSGFTVYLGGFDWVTFPTPQHLLQKYPEFLPLPQQVFKTSDDEVDVNVEEDLGLDLGLELDVGVELSLEEDLLDEE
jgi:hypothetical protein